MAFAIDKQHFFLKQQIISIIREADTTTSSLFTISYYFQKSGMCF